MERDVPEPDSLDLTVVTPSYGYAHFLRDAIVSVAEQPGITVEHIVQDGGSTDGTVELLQELDDRVDWVSEPDDGQSDALNRGIARARGRWIAWLNADEFYLPGGLAALVRAGRRDGRRRRLRRHPLLGRRRTADPPLPQHRFSPFVLRSYGCFISTVSCIVRRDRRSGDDPIDVVDAADDGLGPVSAAARRGGRRSGT